MKSITLLLRQIHPNFFQKGKLTSQSFIPFPKDNLKISVYDGEFIKPEDSYNHYTQDCHLQSIGVWGISNSEVSAIGLTSERDPLPDSPYHALVNFSTISAKSVRRILALKLMALAEARGCLYKPNQED
jgi:hypothetical protein